MKKEAKKEEHSKIDHNSYGVASAVVGIFSVMFFSPIYGTIAGIIAIIFANKQNKILKNGWSKAGRILGIIGIILSILTWIFLIWLSKNPDFLAQYIGGTYGLQ